MSLTVRRDVDKIFIQYSNSEHSVEIILNLKDGSTTVLNNNNVRIVLETTLPAIASSSAQRSSIKDYLGLDKEVGIKPVVDEVLKLLIDHKAFNEDHALSINDIIEVSQYEKDKYPKIDEFLNQCRSLGKAKKMLALALGVLIRSGLAKKIKVLEKGTEIHKYIAIPR